MHGIRSEFTVRASYAYTATVEIEEAPLRSRLPDIQLRPCVRAYACLCTRACLCVRADIREVAS